MKNEYDFSKGERGRFYLENARIGLPGSDEKTMWGGPTGRLGEFIVQKSQKSLNAYREQPKLIMEHARSEQDTAQGGYAHRQLFELVQNSADALLDSPKGKSILIRLTAGFLYCADDGTPIDEDGIEGLMFDRMSSKRQTAAIGRFGRGFKSVLGVTDAPEFYSRSGSFSFEKKRAAERIAKVSLAERYPVLRLPEPIEPDDARETDEELRELMSWATNVVRLPLKTGTYGDLAQQIRDFPPEFMLFVDHVRYLTLEDGEGPRDFMLHRQDGELLLDTGEETARWRSFDGTHRLSAEARADWHLHDDDGDVLIQWAAPLDRLDRSGHFWAFFPTSTASLVAGILNAPWKTNEDRQNLLPGPYNEELIEVAARMIAEALPNLATDADPARHLDVLPRRQEAGDTKQSVLLRNRLLSHLSEWAIVPDQSGKLHTIGKISYPPKSLTDSSSQVPLERWAAYLGRPSNWLHHRALTRNRLASIDRLFPPQQKWSGNRFNDSEPAAPRATIADWLWALVDGKQGDEAIHASMAAIQTAAAMSSAVRSNGEFGDIVLTAGCDWRSPDPEHLFFPDETQAEDVSTGTESYVHPDLVLDKDTYSALEELGLKHPSPESAFKLLAEQILKVGSSQEPDSNEHIKFWSLSRKVPIEKVLAVIGERKDYYGLDIWPTKLRVRTLAGEWRPRYSVLLPGNVVPGDGSRDGEATVDTHLHEPDDRLLRTLGVTELPQADRNLASEANFTSFRSSCRSQYSKQDRLPYSPSSSYLDFMSPKGVGPLEVLTVLSDEGKALYTDALLRLDACYEPWTMWHTGTNRQAYPKMPCESLTIHMLREHGRIRISDGTVPLEGALGSYPSCPEALRALLVHPMADKIRAAFDLSDPTPEFSGEGDPVPLTDVWPGLKGFLPAHRKQSRLVSCERILVVGQATECVFHTPDIYLVGAVDDEEQRKLKLIADELELRLKPSQIEAILQRRTSREVEERRTIIRQYSTDAERLLAAVGEIELRSGLPGSLLAVLEDDGATVADTEIAEVAIATYHTDALKQYGWALDHLDPPSQWAGSARAVEFVRSLGFSAEWAGERNEKRDPFLEVEGPYSLPKLHDYQRTIVENVRKLLCDGHSDGAERRGMISLPTGSGKTRVAVQAIVEAMRDDGFRGGILWVADRDELCEQAVESWRQVWSSIGTEAVHLRISRMWAGQPSPIPTNDLHVIVATIQTLHSRFNNQGSEYEFLADFKLVVFDEAHRSLARTFTSVMGEVGLTRFQKLNEPFILGLTATPYRGHDEEETERLVRRYGNKRLDSGAFLSDEPEVVIGELQEMGVLAQADHETIEGETFQLDTILDCSFDNEEVKRILDEWRALPWLPERVEKRIAQSPERTKRIVEAYGHHIKPNWSTLIFVTSVEHARTLAALLNRIGIQSRSVSGETGTATRPRIVEEFRGGEIKALVNYGVFGKGFDAPKTRAIIVARPVYSPNLYFQMIGRGLRGPLNGGDDRCLILNVRDNIENFDRALAFSELDWLWAR